MITSERYIRQRDLIPEVLKESNICVIGTGAIGRQVAIQLTAMGVGALTLIDFDTVNIENLAAQGFMEKDLGRPKVEAVAELCRQINTEVQIETHNVRFSARLAKDIMMCCVDSIDTRRNIFNRCRDIFKVFVDGRMSAETMRILIVDNPESAKYYESTLFRGSEAVRGSCTSKTTIYCASIAAGMMISKLVTSLRGCDISKDVSLNLITDDLTIG